MSNYPTPKSVELTVSVTGGPFSPDLGPAEYRYRLSADGLQRSERGLRLNEWRTIPVDTGDAESTAVREAILSVLSAYRDC